MSFTFGASAQPAGEGAQSGFTFGGTSSAGQSNSLFGNTSNQPAQRQSTGFSFGNTATSQPATGGFNFGTNTATSQPSTGGFSFGTSGAGTSGGLFGSTSQPSQSSTGGFGFGANTATSQPSTGRFGFGTSTTTSQPSTGGFSFGTNTATSQPATSGFSFGNAGGAGGLIGSTNQSSMTGTGSLFGSTSKPAQTGGFGSLFGNNTSNLQQSQAQAQRSRQVYDLLLQANAEARQEELLSASTKQKYRPKNTWQHLALINSYWDKNSPYCRFKYYFYNLVPPQEVHLYQKPPNHDQKAWDEAQRKNPDPGCLVPALAVSFSDLDKRVEAQKKQKDAQIATLQATEEKLNKLKSQNAERQKRIIESKKRQMELVQRVLHLIRYVTIIRRKGLSITPLEEKMTASLEYIQDQVQRSEQFHGKLSQLWAQWQLIKESGRKYGKVDGLEGWKGVSSENLQQMTKVLDELQNALEHTMQILEEDEKNVDKIIEQRGRYLQ